MLQFVKYKAVTQLNLIDTQQAVSKQPERVYGVKPALSDGQRLDYVRQWQPNPTSWTAF